MNRSNSSIAVVGATGHTGQFVVQEALRRGLSVVAVGRSAARLDETTPPGISRRVVKFDDPASLEQAFTGCAVVINCAGPFLDTAAPVARAGLHGPFLRPLPRIRVHRCTHEPADLLVDRFVFQIDDQQLSGTAMEVRLDLFDVAIECTDELRRIVLAGYSDSGWLVLPIDKFLEGIEPMRPLVQLPVAAD